MSDDRSPISARDLFLELVDLDADAQRDRLDAVAPALADKVRRLLEADRDGTLFARPFRFTASVPEPLRDVETAATLGDRPVSSDALLAPGTRIGPLEVLELLGAGGMGEVYCALDTRLDRRVAMKSIRGAFRAQPGARERFLREARILSSLEHPGICRIYDYIEHEHGDYIVLELIDGHTIDEAIVGRRTRSTLGLAAKLARVLAVAHAAGVVHRDLKPANVMVTADDQVKVLDFGIARADGQRVAESDRRGGATPFVTQAGAVAGTPMYMSPEQAAGEDVTAASDVYSFGLLLQQLLAGELPREPSADVATALDRARRGDRRPLRGVRRDVAALIDRLTQPKPVDRPTALDAARQIERILATPRRRLAAGAIAAVVLVLVGGSIKYTVDLAREREVAVGERREVERSIRFILEDLRPRVEQVGRLDLLEGAADRVLEYYQARDPGDLDNRDLLDVARSLQLVGEVRMAQGDAAGARPAFERQRDMLQQLLENDRSDGDVLFSLAQAHFYVGHMAYQQQDHGGALDAFDGYLEAATALSALDPDRPDWALEVAYATSSRATVYQRLAASAPPEDAGRYRTLRSEAREQSITLKRAIVAAHPTFSAAALGLANDLSFRAGARWSACDREGALVDAGEAVEIVQVLRDHAPDDVATRHQLSMKLARAAGLARDQGRHEQARGYYVRMQEETRALVELAPDRVDWLSERANGLLLLGTTLADLGRHDQASAFFDSAQAGFESWLQLEPEAADARRGLAETDLGRAGSAMATDDAAGALALVRRGLDHLDGLDAALSIRTRAWLLIQEGRALQETGEDGAASFVGALDGVAGQSHDEREMRILRATSLLHLGRVSEATVILDELNGCGGVPDGLQALLGARSG